MTPTEKSYELLGKITVATSEYREAMERKAAGTQASADAEAQALLDAHRALIEHSAKIIA